MGTFTSVFFKQNKTNFNFNLIFTCSYSLWRHDGRLDIIDLINGVLGSLVSITAGCFLYRAWEALIIGLLGALLCVLTMPLFDRLGVDDPVGASSVHGVCGIWVSTIVCEATICKTIKIVFCSFA